MKEGEVRKVKKVLGIEFKSVGLTKEEKEILLEAVRMGIRRVQYKRKKEKRPELSYWIGLE